MITYMRNLMLTHWNKLLTTDCTVIEVSGHKVYPIHRVGYTSLMSVAEQTHTNTAISDLSHITILIRDPNDRFVSGVNEYCRQNNLQIEDVYQQIKNGDLVDSHFIPQYVWLMNLYRFYKGQVTLRPFEFISTLTQVHKRKDEQRQHVEPLRNFTEVDAQLLKNNNQRSQSLRDVIKEYKHVLS